MSSSSWTQAVTNVQSLTEDASGDIWVTDSKEVLMRLSTHSTPQHERAIRLPTGAWRVMRDSRGQIWAAAFGGGLMRVRDPLDTTAIIEHYEYEHRLAGSPRSLYEDREGNIWVGMRGGLIRLSESSFTSVTQLEGLTNEGVRTATVGSDGSVWVATGHGLNRFSALRSHGVQPVADDGAAQRSPRHDVGLRRRADQPVRERTFRAGRCSGDDSEKPRDGVHDGFGEQPLALHCAQGRDDVGRQVRHELRG